MKICNNCGAQNLPERETCLACSAPLTEASETVEAAPVAAESAAASAVEIPRPRRLWPSFLWLIPIPVLYVLALVCRTQYYGTYESHWRLLYNICRYVMPVIIGLSLVLCAVFFFRALGSRLKYRRACRNAGVAPQLRRGKKKERTRGKRGLRRAARLGRDGETVTEDEAVTPEEQEALEMGAVSSYSTLLEIDAAMTRREMPSYTPTPTPKALNRAFRAFAAEKGVRVDKKQTSALFAAMGASRVVWVIDRRPELTHKLLEVLAEFLGTTLHMQTVGEGWSSLQDLLVEHHMLKQGESAFFADLYTAAYQDNGLCIAALDGVDPKTADAYFATFFDYSNHPNRQVTIPVPRHLHGEHPRRLSGNYYELPNNLWFFLRLDSKEVSALPEGSMPLDLGDLAELDHKHPRDEEIEPVVLSLSSFLDLLEDAKAERYLAEEYWKKLDALEEYMARLLPSYQLSNRVARQIEAYAALYLPTGATAATEILDLVVAYKMLPALAECQREPLADQVNGLSVTLDRIFGLDNMPHCLRVLRQMHLV